MNRYKFTQISPEPHPPPVPPLIPFAHTPFDAYLSIPASTLRERVSGLREKEGFFTLQFVPDGTGDQGTSCDKGDEWSFQDVAERGKGRVKVAGVGAWSWRCK